MKDVILLFDEDTISLLHVISDVIKKSYFSVFLKCQNEASRFCHNLLADYFL